MLNAGATTENFSVIVRWIIAFFAYWPLRHTVCLWWMGRERPAPLRLAQLSHRICFSLLGPCGRRRSLRAFHAAKACSALN